jgi:hypothetical protein
VTELTRTSKRRPVFRLALDRVGAQARARLRPGGAVATVTLCAHRPSRPLFSPGQSTGTLRADFESEACYGAGWRGAERNEAGPLRRGENVATLLLPLARGFSYHLALDLSSAGNAPVALTLDGYLVGRCDLEGGTRCALDLPPTALGGEVSALTLERLGPPQPALLFRGARLDRDAGDAGAASR